MTKIKKTVWSKLFGFVLGFALVFSLLFANTGLVANATTVSEDAQTYVGYSVGYKDEDTTSLKVTSSILVNNDFRGKNVLKAKDLYENKLTDVDKLDVQVVNAKKVFDQVWEEIFKAPQDVLDEINARLQPMLDREGGVVYSDKTAFEEVKAHFDALDENQKAYVQAMKENVSEYPEFMSEYENSYETYLAVEQRIKEICEEIDRVVGLINNLETNTASGVRYSQKADYDALVVAYNNLDESAREEVNRQANEEVLETVKNALTTIEARATATNTAISNMLYYVEGEMVANPEGEVVYDSKTSVEAVTALIDAIYDGTENVANLNYTDDRDEFNALVNAELISTYENYDAAVTTLAGYKAQAEEVEANINAITLTVDNNYKVLENTIVNVYDSYTALNFTEYGTHHNLQNYLAEESKTKIEETKATLDAVNAWIAKVAMFVDETATPETADSVITSILEKGNLDDFISLDMDKVEELLAEHTTLCGEDEIITKSVEDAKKVLDMIKARVEELEEEVQEVVDGLDELETLLTSGIKYSYKTKYEEVKAKYDALPEGALKDAVSEQATALTTVKTALDTIEKRAEEAKTAIANILYYLEGEMVADPTGEIVVASGESLVSAIEAVTGIYDGTENIAELEYPWGEDGIELNALVNANLIAGLDKFDAAVLKYAEFVDSADSVNELIDAIVLSAENNYKTLEDAINNAYDAYVALNHTEYNGMHNIQDLLEEEVKTKIVDAKTVLDNINAWILEVAKLVNADATAETADEIISEANALETIVVTTLDTTKVEELLNSYATLNTDDATESAMSEAYEVLNKIKTRVEELNNQVEEVEDMISNLPTENIKYSDRPKYEEAKEKYEALDEIAKEKVNEETNAEEVLETIKNALSQIEENARLASEAIANIEYYKDGEMVKDSSGEIVYDSKSSIDLATEALAKVYDGTNNVANLPYKWDEVEIAALSEFVANLAEYDNAVESLNALKAEADEVATKIDELNVTAENHYKVLEDSINETYDAYVALNKEGYFGHNNLQNFLTEEQQTKIVETKRTLDNINGWILEVAQLVNADATAENADEIISEANTLETVTVITLDVNRVQELLNAYSLITNDEDEAKVASLAEAYEVLNKVKARVEELIDEVEDVVETLTEFESMTSTGIKYSYKAKYEEVKAKYDALDQVAKDKVNEESDAENVLTTVKTALDEIENRAHNAENAISNILYLVNGEMKTDATGEVVYASDVTITAAKEALAKIYDGTENIANLEYAWDETEIKAFQDNGILMDLAKFDTANEALEALKAEAKAVADRISALEITAENNYKTQEDEINNLYADFDGLNRGEFNNLQNYVEVDLANKINEAKAELDKVNAWILKVATLVDANATSADADQIIADTLESGVSDIIRINVNAVKSLLEEHATAFAIDEVLTASVKDAKEVLDMLKARYEEIDKQLKETIEDVVNRDRNGELVPEDYNTIKDTQNTHDELDDSQKDLLDETLANETDTSYPEFCEIANKFLFSIYFKQAVDELYKEVGENYFTVEGYVLDKTLNSMYNTFDTTMLNLVKDYKGKLDAIDEAYEAHKDDLLDYNKLKEEFESKLEALKAEYQEKLNALNADLDATKEEYNQKLADLQNDLSQKLAEFDQKFANLEDELKASIDEKIDLMNQTIESLRNVTDEIEREITALRNTVENSITSAKNALQSQIDELKKSDEDQNKQIDTLKKIIYIGGAVYGVLIIALAIGLISVSKKKNAAMKEGTVVGEDNDSEADDDEE